MRNTEGYFPFMFFQREWAKFANFSGSLGFRGAKGRCGGILVVELPKYPHIFP